jgi:hypothetical protein
MNKWPERPGQKEQLDRMMLEITVLIHQSVRICIFLITQYKLLVI